MIVIINPNSTVSMTDAMVQTARKAVPGLNVVGWTSTMGPPAIQGAQDGDAAIPPLLELVKMADDEGATAVIIGCFDDTGLYAARELASCPVIGIGQAAYHVASLFGHRFSVVTTLDVSVPVLAANISSYGLNKNLGCIRASGVPVLALEDDRENATRQVKAEIRTALREDDIDSIVLGCAGMVHIVDDSDDVPIKLIDGVHAAVHLASMF
ncbi:aspartate/glutamate racemase family protein [Octadecabacter sp. G9-8]|uniref:Aspartate/glutamate racemase family protein n=1 Tax=Octadecabacter dasysiphoniae TaxID=2909341 RepID=A0ABS9CYI8_9RHOB|nr:aspartate/glutamate racemase family protein [Octadecabacter dasysiphoniae]MCF2872345.1 aspartate/glutamate racemase family protein [Octadecabacter dasysiphoniae]